MSQNLMNQKSNADDSNDVRAKQSANGEFKQFLKHPLGIALAMLLIVLLSGTTFVVGKASVNKVPIFCIFSLNCGNPRIGGETKAEGKQVEINEVKPPKSPENDHSLEIAIGVGAIATALWWIILSLL